MPITPLLVLSPTARTAETSAIKIPFTGRSKPFVGDKTNKGEISRMGISM